MGLLRFRVLGPVEVLRDGSPVALGGRPSVNLLAGLLLSANQPVTYDRLAGIVWGNRLPAHPQAALQSLKSRLGRALGGDAIQTVTTGYQMTVEDDELDLLRFERLMGLPDPAEGEGDEPAHRAVAAVDQALSLWNLPVLANVHSDILLREGVSFLTERYLSAQERRAALRLKLGQYRVVIAELSRLVLAHPFREDLVGLLMLALYRSHRQADALAVYQYLQQELRESLGVDPSEPLQRLHLEILRRDTRLDQPDAAPVFEAPVLRATVLEATVLEATDAYTLAPPLAGDARSLAERVPRQLPPDAGDFTGRGAELSAVLRALGATPVSRTIVLAGPGGIGKTALAVHAGHQLSAAFPDGQAYLDAGAAGTQPGKTADLVAELLLAFGVTRPLMPATRPERVGLYRSLAAGRRFLLILDHVSSEAQVRDLLPPGPGCAAIICARPRLAGFPGAELIELDVLDQSDALAFLGQIIGQGRLSQEPESAAELARLCGGLPLALRVAGARLAARPHWRLATLAGRLADERHRLDELTYGDLDVRATIAATYMALSPCAQQLLRKLAALEAPDIPRWAVTALLDGQCAAAEELCETLADAQLLDASDGPSGPRYRLPDLVGAYARDLEPHPAPSAKIEIKSVPRLVRETRTSRPCLSRITSPAAASRSQ